MPNNKEATARIKINQLLEKAGWNFFDGTSGSANITLEMNVKIKQKDLDALGSDFEKSKNGFIDYLLLDANGYPLCVLEAKKESTAPLFAKEQARKYAQTLNVRFVILSNGNAHYFWDLHHGNPEIITEFPRQESLGYRSTFKPDMNALADEKVNADYIALTQNPQYAEDPQWQNEVTRQKFITDSGLRLLRPYQVEAVHALQRLTKEGNVRFLFEMATGTGKTLVAAAVIKLFLRTGNAKRILFLVDRLELEKQAEKSFMKCLRKDFRIVIYNKLVR